MFIISIKTHMKKLILLFCALLSLSNQASETLPWRTNFKQIDNPEWSQAPIITEQWEKLKHNPQITLFEKKDRNLVNQSGPTLFVHGWGDSKDSRKTHNRCTRNDILPGDVIAFNFPDASHWVANTIPYKMPLSKSSFAGDPDIATLLCVLKTLHLADSLPAVLYAHSRGAGTTCKTIGILNSPTEDDEDNFLTQWKISETERADIISSFRVIYIIDPLTNFDIALHQQVRTKLMIVDWLLPSFIENRITPHIKGLLPSITQYNPNTYKNAIDYIKQWNGIKIPVWLHFEKNDEVVGNEDNVECVQKFLSAIPSTLHVSCTDNGGHKAYEIFINTIVHAFNKQAECSYLKGQHYDDENTARTIKDANITFSITTYDPEITSEQSETIGMKIENTTGHINTEQKITHHLNKFSQKYTANQTF
jgi:pimeloyl-ACP methyl ester carboxylesterase